MTHTPASLSDLLGKSYKGLRKDMERLGIACAKDTPLSRAQLIALCEYNSTPHPRRDPAICEQANKIKTRLQSSSTSFVAPAATKETSTPEDVQDSDKEPSESTPEPQPQATSATESDKETDASDIETPYNDSQSDKGDKHDKGRDMWSEWYKAGGVMGLIGIQAWIFASLAETVLDGKHELPFFVMFAAAVLIESAGIMIAKDMPAGKTRKKVAYERGKRTETEVTAGNWIRPAWLLLFFAFQVAVDAAFVDVTAYQNTTELAGKLLVIIAIPGGILAYSHLYLHQNQ